MYVKNSLKNIVFIVICIFFMVLALSSFRNLKKMELDFNEKKATLVKESLDLRDRINALQETLNQKSDALTSLEGDKEALETELTTIKKENEDLIVAHAKELESVQTKNEALKKRLAALEKAPIVTKIKEAIAREDNADIKKVLESAIENIELVKSGKAVNLEPIVVTNPSDAASAGTQGAAATTAKDGTILSVDAKNNLIVINLGRKDEIQEGDLFKVFKGADEIAEAEIISIRYRIAAAFVSSIQPKYTINDVKEGSRAVLARR